MKTKYLCEDCCELFDSKDIAYKYAVNVNGNRTVIEYTCKKCAKKQKESKY